MIVGWEYLKAFVDERSLSVQWLDLGDTYWLKAFDGIFSLETTLDKDLHSAEVAVFEASYKPSGNRRLVPRDVMLNREVVSHSAFAVNTDYEVKATGFTGTAAAGVTTAIDFPVGVEDRYINGLELLCQTATMGDTVDLAVVDKDGIFEGVAYPPGTPLPVVLRQFGFNWNASPDKVGHGLIVFNYVARLIAGLYVRINYHSVGDSSVKVACNLLLHKKVS